jgi:hypothetical protein
MRPFRKYCPNYLGELVGQRPEAMLELHVAQPCSLVGYLRYVAFQLLSNCPYGSAGNQRRRAHEHPGSCRFDNRCQR